MYKWFHFQVSPVFDHCTCYIITTSAGVLTPDYEALTNQGHVSFSVYRPRNLLQ
jgi:hypothetical protein